MIETRIIELADIERPAPDVAELLEIIDAQSRRILRDTNLRGAGIAVLHEIHAAGGYHVLDPSRQASVQRAISALENAVQESMP